MTDFLAEFLYEKKPDDDLIKAGRSMVKAFLGVARRYFSTRASGLSIGKL